MLFRRRKKYNYEIDPDEIFLDASNLPQFDRYQFEGRLEKPLSKNILMFVGMFFVFVSVLFISKLVVLQIIDVDSLKTLAENNRLRQVPIFSERGVIFDRNGTELVWNEPLVGEDGRKYEFSQRKYIDKKGIAHVLGYVRYPLQDKNGYYYEDKFLGKNGLEFSYDDILNGANGLKLIETNALEEVVSQSVIEVPVNGENLILSMDVRVQGKLFEIIRDLAKNVGFDAGAGIVMDVSTGEILALTNFPEYNSGVLSLGQNEAEIEAFRNDWRKPFLNRATAGLYAPGSIVKPFLALGALRERIIRPEEKILSTGSISIPHPYFPNQKSIFKDWKAHGWVTMEEALAVSSNVYFYAIGGGYEKQEGLGIEKIESWMGTFGFGKKTNIDLSGEGVGIIPTPQWKQETFQDEWRIGDTYNTAIGQYGFQITPIQAVRAISAIANGGILLRPSIVSAIERDDTHDANSSTQSASVDIKIEEKIKISEAHFEVVRSGMRKAVLEGTASGLNIPHVSIAAKTGTAQIGILKKRVNSWIVGFFPYEEPRFAFAIVMERGPQENLIGALYVMRQLLEWMAIETPEYLE